MYDVSGLYPLQQSLVIGSYVKMLLRGVLSDRHRITQEIICTPWYYDYRMCEMRKKEMKALQMRKKEMKILDISIIYCNLAISILS